jgi:hypothetical protein
MLLLFPLFLVSLSTRRQRSGRAGKLNQRGAISRSDFASMAQSPVMTCSPRIDLSIHRQGQEEPFARGNLGEAHGRLHWSGRSQTQEGTAWPLENLSPYRF